MGRLPRLQFPGACYHVVMKGDGGDPVFLDDADRERALELLAEMKRRFRVRLFAYCLLDSRIELALETPDGNLARAMQGFGTAYTKYFNGRRGRTGHVFGGRYRSALVDKGEALAELTRRVHRAPVGPACERPTRFAWSSCRAYTEGARGAGLVDTETVLKQFGRSRFRQSVKYLKFVAADPLTLPSPASGRGMYGDFPLPLGEVDPKGRVRATELAGVGELVDLEALIRDAGAECSVKPEEIRGRSRTPGVCRARRSVAYSAWEAGVKVADIAAALRKSPAAVSRMVRHPGVRPGSVIHEITSDFEKATQ